MLEEFEVPAGGLVVDIYDAQLARRQAQAEARRCKTICLWAVAYSAILAGLAVLRSGAF